MNHKEGEKMRQTFFMVTGLLLFSMGISLSFMGNAYADASDATSTKANRGSQISIRTISISSTTGATVFSASLKRFDGSCRNNSGYTIYIGTDSGTYQQNHPNYGNGFPILSTETFKLDGEMTGAVYGTLEPKGAGNPITADLRCIDGIVP